MALFWPEAGPDAASDSPRSSLTILRQTLRPAADLIGADRYTIWINPASDYWCDADEFERLIEDSRKVVMKDTGHIPMAERPQAFNDVLVEFLAESGPAEEKEPAAGESLAA